MATPSSLSDRVPSFREVEDDRTIVFGRGAIDAADDLLGEAFVLLCTPRSRLAVPGLVGRSARIVDVRPGRVDLLAGELRSTVGEGRLVAVGGGRVIDVGKALAAADPPRRVVAVPTTLSGAEMTGFHRHAAGVPPETPHVRPAVVINDPGLSASAPTGGLAASTGNAFGHALVAAFSVQSNPVGRAVAAAAAGRLADGWREREPDRDKLAHGALLAGYAVDQTGLGPHHAICQTLVRIAGIGHAEANVAMLESTVAGTRRRQPAGVAELEAELGLDLEWFARELCDRAGVGPLVGLCNPDLLDRVVAGVLDRSELERVPPGPDADELRAIFRAAAGPAGPDPAGGPTA